VHVDPDLTTEQAQEHRDEYGIQSPVLLDARHVWVAEAGATRTPEAAVFAANGELLYRGRIDDRYVDFGKRRTQATSADLRDAVTAILAGHAVAEPRTVAIGCFIPEIGPQLQQLPQQSPNTSTTSSAPRADGERQ
jgi:hypothetical protein